MRFPGFHRRFVWVPLVLTLFTPWVTWAQEAVSPVPGAACDPSFWTLNGSAQDPGDGRIILTQPQQAQTGSSWAPTLLDLRQDFDLSFKVYLGSNPSGSDGIAFVIQAQGLNALGGRGGGQGYGDLDGFPPLNPLRAVHPSVAVEIDTHPNIEFPDPSYDHMAVVENGRQENLPANPEGVQPAMPGGATVKDGREHDLNVRWDAARRLMEVRMDGRQVMTYLKDMVSLVFGGNPMVYWGFTGTCGGDYNLQYFRLQGCGQSPTPTPTFVPVQPTATSTVTSTPTVIPATPTGTATATHPPSVPTMTPTEPSTGRRCRMQQPIAFPNPCRGGQVRFRCPGLAAGDAVRMTVFSSSGRKIREESFYCPSDPSKDGFDVVWELKDRSGDPVSNGLYHVRFTQNGFNGHHICKVVILR